MAQAKRKKRFFDVEIPIIKKTTQAQGYEISELGGRFITYDLTRILRGKGMILSLYIKIEDGKAVAHPKEVKLVPYFLRRMMRKGTNYVEDSFSTDCKNAQIRIKPFLITRRKVSRKVRKVLREKAREELIKTCKNKDKETLFDEVLRNQIQKNLSLRLKKIYPLSLCEIRILKVEKEFLKEEVIKKEETNKDKVVQEEVIEESLEVKEKPKKEKKKKPKEVKEKPQEVEQEEKEE